LTAEWLEVGPQIDLTNQNLENKPLAGYYSMSLKLVDNGVYGLKVEGSKSMG